MRKIVATHIAGGFAAVMLLGTFGGAAPDAVAATSASINVEPVKQISGRARSWISAGVEQMGGDTSYRIGFPVFLPDGTRFDGHFPFSELEFPLDSTMLSIRFGAEFNDKVIISGALKKALTDPDDNFIDRDWITAGNPGRLDVYSESRVEDYSATIIDIDAAYKFLRRQDFWLAAGGGYLHQDFSFDNQLIRQYSPSGLPGFDYNGDGEVGLTYDINYKIPYLMLKAGSGGNGPWSFSGKLAYAPVIDVDDTDHHIYRNKMNKGDLEGEALMLSVGTRYDFSPRFFAAAGLDYTYITADGDSSAFFYGSYDHHLAEEVESSQFSAYISLGFKFWSSPEQPKQL